MRKVTFPKLKGDRCEPCNGTGKLPPELAPDVVCRNCGVTTKPEQANCPGCSGKGTIDPPTPLLVLGSCLNPTQKETQEGEGVGMVAMALNYPIAKELKDSTDRGEMFLTPDQWEHLKARMDVTKWRIYSDHVYLICKAVLDAEDVEASQVEQANQARKIAKEEKSAARAAAAAGRGPKLVESVNGESEVEEEVVTELV